jgi:simple sugar transport system permease protein
VSTAVGLVALLYAAAFPQSFVGKLLGVAVLDRSLRLSVPITLAAIGGLYSEKSGVFNIGLEGFLIFGAFFAAASATVISGESDISQIDLWLSVLTATAFTTVLAFIFAVLTIRYEANQIVAGLAIWFMGLGFAPFGAIVIWGRVNSTSLASIEYVTVPVLSEIPLLGEIVFDTSPLVLIMLVVVALAYVVLYYTRWGYWVQAAGENPAALDTAGVSVTRVRYAAVTLSGLLCGIGGASLSIAFSSGFVGRGVTMVNGRGWIAIATYLFGNYNPLGTFGASLLFGFVNAAQIELQTIGVNIPSRLVGLFPYFAVLIVLVLVGKTRMPSAAGESYETEEK